jgi:hypothetical protein
MGMAILGFSVNNPQYLHENEAHRVVDPGGTVQEVDACGVPGMQHSVNRDPPGSWANLLASGRKSPRMASRTYSALRSRINTILFHRLRVKSIGVRPSYPGHSRRNGVVSHEMGTG